MERCKLKRKLISVILSLVISVTLGQSVFAAENSTPQAPPKLVAEAAIAIDANTGEVIYSKNLDQKVYPASTTKLLTALILAQYRKPSDILTYTASAKSQPSAALNTDVKPLNPGDTMTADNALKALLIFSANDIAYMIADNIIGNTNATVSQTNDAFSALMNKKAAQLGLKDSHFVTPNGLHDPNHYTTAYDMSVIAKNAFENKWILSTMEIPKTVVETTNGTQFPIENRNKLILPSETSLYDSTCLAGKTGYTNEAGKCLVAIFDRNGRKIIGVIMKSAYDANDTQSFKDMEAMINYSYSINYTTLEAKNTTYKTENVSYKPLFFFGPTETVKVPLVINQNIQYYKNDVNDKEKKLTSNVSPINLWKLNSNNPIGTLTLTERGVTKNYKLYSGISTSTIISDNKYIYIGIGAILLILIVLIIISIVKLIGKFKKKRRRYYY